MPRPKSPAQPPKPSIMAGADPLYTPQEVADAFRSSLGNLSNRRARGDDPKPFHVGRRVFYRQSDLDAWTAAGCP